MSKARNKKSAQSESAAVAELDLPVAEQMEADTPVLEETRFEEEMVVVPVVETVVEEVIAELPAAVEEVTVVDVAEEIQPAPEQVLEVQPAAVPEQIVQVVATPEQIQAAIDAAVKEALAKANPKKAPKRSKDKMEVAGACVAIYGYETPITREMIDYINDNYGIANDQTSMACLKAARATLRGYAEPIRTSV